MAKVRESERARILIVDDDEQVRELLTEALTRRGYSVHSVHTAEIAWQSLNADPRYDLVITDLKMPVMDGLQLLERIRERVLAVQVILWTGSLGYGVAARAQELKAVAVLTKGEGLDKLLQSVERALMPRAVGGKEAKGKEGDSQEGPT